MVGAAILSARGTISESTIDAALRIPYKITLPMVPAQGLYLQYSGFGKNANKVNTAIARLISTISS